MKTNLQLDFLVDKENHTVTVKREFAAPRALVWKAWTTPEILDQWWAPRPWKTKTKEMNFEAGGHWLYSMVGPENEEHFCRADYHAVTAPESFTATDGFCDEEGVINTAMPTNKWETTFIPQGEHTLVNVHLTFDSLQDLETIIEMGFREGFLSALGNLDEVLEKQTV